jgi:RHS repeat-associated protein
LRKLTRLYQNNQLIKTRIFAGNYEKEINHLNGDVKEFNYISGPNGLIAVYIVMNGTGTLYYTVTDHLGSIVQLIDANGTVIDETNYGPWGRYRDPNTWQYDNTASLSMIHRGYTGHEMLPEFGLIHMNGRMYDPLLGRMLSPDNYVQDPNNPNNYNRYAYCMNNPLKYTDPSGEWVASVVGALIFGYLGGSAANYWEPNPIDWDWHNEGTYVGIGFGMLTGAAGGYAFTTMGGALAETSLMINFGASGIKASYTLAGIVTGATSGYLTGFGSGYLGTGNIEYAKESGKMGAGIGTAIGGLAGYFYGEYEMRRELLKDFMDTYGDEEYSKYDTEYAVGGIFTLGFGNKDMSLTVPLKNKPSGMDIHGSPGYKSKIYFSKYVLKDYYDKPYNREGKGLMYHEFLHAKDYYTGWDSFIVSALGRNKAMILLEYNTYQRVYERFGVQKGDFDYYRNRFNEIFY